MGAPNTFVRDDHSKTGWALWDHCGNYYRIAFSRTDLLARIAEMLADGRLT